MPARRRLSGCGRNGQRLWAGIPDATPFQTPDWLIPWWRHIGEGRLLTLAVRDTAAALIGLFPFYVYTRPGGGERSLFPLGIATTDYLDALVLPGREAAAMAAAFGHLAKRRADWDICDWPQLRPDSPLSPRRRRAGRAASSPPSPARRCACRPALRRSANGSPARRCATCGRIAGGPRHVVTCAGRSRNPTPWNRSSMALLRLHAARWATRDEAGVLASPAVQAAHREALPGLFRAGLLRFQALRLDGEIVAALYGLADPPGRDGRRVYLYLSGFDPRLERLSPGLLLVGQAVEAAIAEGMACVDFLRGRETYKYFWGAQDRPTFRRRLRPFRGGGRCDAC